MKLIFCGVLTTLLLISNAADAKRSSGSRSSTTHATSSSHKSTSVKSHTRRDGTYVAGHSRTTPNKRTSDNYSTKGNYNPHTGKTGTRVSPTKSK